MQSQLKLDKDVTAGSRGEALGIEAEEGTESDVPR